MLISWIYIFHCIFFVLPCYDAIDGFDNNDDNVVDDGELKRLVRMVRMVWMRIRLKKLEGTTLGLKDRAKEPATWCTALPSSQPHHHHHRCFNCSLVSCQRWSYGVVVNFNPLLRREVRGLLSISSHCCSFDRAALVKVKPQGRAIGKLVAPQIHKYKLINQCISQDFTICYWYWLVNTNAHFQIQIQIRSIQVKARWRYGAVLSANWFPTSIMTLTYDDNSCQMLSRSSENIPKNSAFAQKNKFIDRVQAIIRSVGSKTEFWKDEENGNWEISRSPPAKVRLEGRQGIGELRSSPP